MWPHPLDWLTQSSGAFYAVVSGWLGDLTLLTAGIAFARHKNCHVRHCWRFGRPVEGTAYLACHHHHPDHEGDSRNVSEETIKQARESTC